MRIILLNFLFITNIVSSYNLIKEEKDVCYALVDDYIKCESVSEVHREMLFVFDKFMGDYLRIFLEHSASQNYTLIKTGLSTNRIKKAIDCIKTIEYFFKKEDFMGLIFYSHKAFNLIKQYHIKFFQRSLELNNQESIQELIQHKIYTLEREEINIKWLILKYEGIFIKHLSDYLPKEELLCIIFYNFYVSEEIKETDYFKRRDSFISDMIFKEENGVISLLKNLDPENNFIFGFNFFRATENNYRKL